MATLYSDNIVKRHLFGEAASYPIRKIGWSDLSAALRLGWEDFQAMPSHAVVVCLIYPVLGLVLFRMVLGHSVLPLLLALAAPREEIRREIRGIALPLRRGRRFVWRIRIRLDHPPIKVPGGMTEHRQDDSETDEKRQ